MDTAQDRLFIRFVTILILTLEVPAAVVSRDGNINLQPIVSTIIRRRIMKKLLILLSVIFLIVSLSGCAGIGAPAGTKVKCPACGHEFAPPGGGPA